MDFAQIEHFEWLKKNSGKVKYNLANSGITNVDRKLVDEITRCSSEWQKKPPSFEGDSDLIGALSEIYHIPADNILTTIGTSMANFMVMSAFIKPGKVVLIENPTYEPLFRVPVMLGAKIEFIKRTAQRKYEFDIEAVKELMSKNVAMIIITNPHNPSGQTLPDASVNALCELAEDNKCILLSDEVYRDFVFDHPPKHANELSEAAVATNSLTKVYGLGNLRTGWLFANPSIIQKCVRAKYHMNVINSPITEEVARNALRIRSRLLDNSRKTIEKTAPRVKKWIKDQSYLELQEFPRSGPFCFPRFCNINVTELSEMLINYYNTMIVPGKFFGAAEFARLGFGTTLDILNAGLEQIENAVNALGAN